MHAAREVFSKFGFRKTTLEDIAKHIGKGKTALYYYYKNKEEIFGAVLDFEVERFSNEMINTLEHETSPQKKLRRYITKRMELYNYVLNFYSAIKSEYLENVAVFEKIRQKYDQMEIEIVSDILSEGIAKNEFVARDVHLTAYAIILAMKGFEYPFSYQQDIIKMEEDIDKLMDVLFYGIIKTPTK